MPKQMIQAIVRSEEKFVRQDATQRAPFFSSKNKGDSFAIETEYVKALQASKMEKMFSKPFVAAPCDHMDGVLHLCTSNRDYNQVFSGSADGTIKMSAFNSTFETFSMQAHRGMVTGLQQSANLLLSTGVDQFVNFYDISSKQFALTHQQRLTQTPRALAISGQDKYAIGCEELMIYDVSKYDPIYTISKSCSFLQFSKTDHNLLGAIDNINLSVIDTRTQQSGIGITTLARQNQFSFNPFQPHQVIVGTDDAYAYAFDLRSPQRALDRYGGLSYPIISLDISPDGQRLALGSNQGTIQLYKIATVSRKGDVQQSTLNKRINEGIEAARAKAYNFAVRYYDMYHNQRMAQVNALRFTADSYYVVSGSEEGTVRVWKTLASQFEKTLNNVELQQTTLNKQLSYKFQNVGEINKIKNSRHLPKKILHQKQRMEIHDQSQLKKLEKRGERAHGLDVVRKE